MEITIEQAKQNLLIILGHDDIKLNKKTHMAAEGSVEKLFSTAVRAGELTKENELLKVKISELETLNNGKG